MKYCPMANKDNLIKTGHFKCLESISQKLRGKASHLFGYYDLLHTYLIFCFSQSVNTSKFAILKIFFQHFPLINHFTFSFKLFQVSTYSSATCFSELSIFALYHFCHYPIPSILFAVNFTNDRSQEVSSNLIWFIFCH